jgi:hypothetical protein
VAASARGESTATKHTAFAIPTIAFRKFIVIRPQATYPQLPSNVRASRSAKRGWHRREEDPPHPTCGCWHLSSELAGTHSARAEPQRARPRARAMRGGGAPHPEGRRAPLRGQGAAPRAACAPWVRRARRARKRALTAQRVVRGRCGCWRPPPQNRQLTRSASTAQVAIFAPESTGRHPKVGASLAAHSHGSDTSSGPFVSSSTPLPPCFRDRGRTRCLRPRCDASPPRGGSHRVQTFRQLPRVARVECATRHVHRRALLGVL